MTTGRQAVIVLAVLVFTSGAAAAQTTVPPKVEVTGTPTTPTRDANGWHATLSLTNLFDGNIDHALNPVGSYGFIPEAEIGYERSSGPAFAWGYAIAVNNYSGTDKWDRLSHNVFTSIGYRPTARVRLETGAEANWKGSSDDRELANTFGISQRATYRIAKSTRVSVTAAYRYKQYGDDPATSGPSPYVAGKIDQRLPRDRRLTFGYRYQRRLSHAVRDRYRRTAYTLAFGTPVSGSRDRLSFEVEYRPQRYERLIRVAGRQVLRSDQRLNAEVAYARPISDRTEVRWIAGIESRSSNDPAKGFLDPSFGVSIGYRVR